ncbi:peptidase inhibitor family I36 protein [Streptomyces cavernae]|uniref:peptidase inhibitor family I36 protein n=1 Tax=Streptomyces cavernae TaxID=2259034 RepID=UPI000FEB8CE8|nr:peptidase inhibitor family I36 protein [Streptomyces cavernae]
MNRKLSALLLAGATVAATFVAATPSHAAPGCDANTVCLWQGKNGGGDLLKWSGGYRDLPPGWHDHVYSFRASRDAAFINYNNGTKECRTVRAGDYADNYDRGFGRVIDAIADSC